MAWECHRGVNNSQESCVYLTYTSRSNFDLYKQRNSVFGTMRTVLKTKSVFVTVGTTSFDELIERVLEKEFLRVCCSSCY